jgi:hypothetical protein
MSSVRTRVHALSRRVLAARHGPGADTFAPIMDQFFDLAPDLLDMGEGVRDPVIEAIVGQAYRSVYPEARTLTMHIIRIRELGLVHGMGMESPRGIAFFYFDALQQGLAVVTDATSFQSTVCRITAVSGQVVQA